MIARQIIKRHHGWTEQAGEWGHIQNGARSEFRRLIEAGDEAGLDALLSRFFQDCVSGGLVSFSYREMEKAGWSDLFTKDMRKSMWLWDLHTGSTGSTDIARLESPAVGSPLVGDIEGVSVQYDTPRHDHYATQIAKLLPEHGRVVEIGGGYGGMALQLLRHRPDANVWIIDLPETLYLAWYWLDAAGVDVGWHGDGHHYVTLMPSCEPRSNWLIDVVFSAHALSEMPREVTDGYMEWIRRCAPRYFYHDSAHDRGLAWHSGYEGSTAEAFPEVQATELDPGPAYREIYRAPTLWPGTRGRYWAFLYEKR